MNIEVAASPEGENELEEFRFAFLACGDKLLLRLVRFRRYSRSDETAPWQVRGEWVYPDLAASSTLTRPEVPAWAMADARTMLFQHISFE